MSNTLNPPWEDPTEDCTGLYFSTYYLALKTGYMAYPKYYIQYVWFFGFWLLFVFQDKDSLCHLG